MMEKREYRPAHPRTVGISSDMFVSGRKDGLIERRLAEIVEKESPVTEELLVKRLLNSFMIFREGGRIEAHLSPMIEGLVADGRLRRRDECGVPVYFTDPAVTSFRTHTGSGSDTRYSYQVPPSEAAACIMYIRENGGEGLVGEALLERFRDEFGWRKAGARVSELFDDALSYIGEN